MFNCFYEHPRTNFSSCHLLWWFSDENTPSRATSSLTALTSLSYTSFLLPIRTSTHQPILNSIERHNLSLSLFLSLRHLSHTLNAKSLCCLRSVSLLFSLALSLSFFLILKNLRTDRKLCHLLSSALVGGRVDLALSMQPRFLASHR